MKKIILCYSILLCMSTAVLLSEGLTPEALNDEALHSEDPSFNIGFKAGTLGLGIDISKPINDFISIRFNANKVNYKTTDDSLYSSILNADKEYQLDTKGLLVDFHLLQLRLTAGAYINNNAIVYTSKPTGNNAVILNGTRYGVNMLEKIDTTVTFNNISPYVGVGWGNNGRREGWGGWNLTLDVGLMYHGDPQIDIKAKINNAVPSIVQTVINANLEKEKKIQEKDLADFPFYPVVMVGLNYSF